MFSFVLALVASTIANNIYIVPTFLLRGPIKNPRNNVSSSRSRTISDSKIILRAIVLL